MTSCLVSFSVTVFTVFNVLVVFLVMSSCEPYVFVSQHVSSNLLINPFKQLRVRSLWPPAIWTNRCANIFEPAGMTSALHVTGILCIHYHGCMCSFCCQVSTVYPVDWKPQYWPKAQNTKAININSLSWLFRWVVCSHASVPGDALESRSFRGWTRWFYAMLSIMFGLNSGMKPNVYPIRFR